MKRLALVLALLGAACTVPDKFFTDGGSGDDTVDASTGIDAGEDTVAPETTIDSAPTSPDNAASFDIVFSANEAATFQCRIDRPGIPGTFSPCASTPSYSDLTANGAYTFQARAVDNVGNLGPATVRSWNVDTQPPDTLIDSGPSGETSSTAATFGFSATEAGSSFECNSTAARGRAARAGRRT